MSNKKEEKKGVNLLAESDNWMRQHGILTENTHNNIIQVIMTMYPFIKDIEYFIDSNHKEMEVLIYLGFGSLIFRRTSRLSNSILQMLVEYLYDYNISVKIKRFKRSK